MSAQMLFLHLSTPEGRELSSSNIFYPDTIWSSACIAFLCNSYLCGSLFLYNFQRTLSRISYKPLFNISDSCIQKHSYVRCLEIRCRILLDALLIFKLYRVPGKWAVFTVKYKTAEQEQGGWLSEGEPVVNGALMGSRSLFPSPWPKSCTPQRWLHHQVPFCSGKFGAGLFFLTFWWLLEAPAALWMMGWDVRGAWDGHGCWSHAERD